MTWRAAPDGFFDFERPPVGGLGPRVILSSACTGADMTGAPHHVDDSDSRAADRALGIAGRLRRHVKRRRSLSARLTLGGQAQHFLRDFEVAPAQIFYSSLILIR